MSAAEAIRLILIRSVRATHTKYTRENIEIRRYHTKNLQIFNSVRIGVLNANRVNVVHVVGIVTVRKL